ncbi:MAG: hypothetical protein Q8R15_03265 [Candidatus Micrarchaeota archaeon]|nr:hypothetical protein [Candidatus Micrarchaeota archaeon]
MAYRINPTGKRALRQMSINGQDNVTYENLSQYLDGAIRFTAAEGENPLFKLRTRKGKHIAIKVFPDQRYEDGIEHYDALTDLQNAFRKSRLGHRVVRPLFATKHVLGMEYIPKRVKRWDEFIKKADKRKRSMAQRELEKIVTAVKTHAPHLLARFDPHEENVFVEQQRNKIKLVIIDAVKARSL